jgi:signal transduction histidine kinase
VSLKNKLLWFLLPLLLAVCTTYAGVVGYQGATIGARMSSQDAALVRETLLIISVVTVGLVAAIGFIAVALSYVLLLKPIHEIVAMAMAVGAGDFGKRLGFTRRDEIGRLASAMDALSDQLQAARAASDAHIDALEQLRHSDRVATLGRLASSVAHELGNPLNVIEMRAQLIVTEDVETLPEARQNAAIIVTQARRMTRIIGEILSFSKRRPAQVAALDLVYVVRNAIALSEHTAKRREQSIQLDATETSIDVQGDADKLLQIVVNLVMNGVQASEAGGVVQVGVRSASQASRHDPGGPEETYACIDVIDHGAGIPEESLSKIFEPFFSSKRPGEGTGLGLSVAQGIAKEHDGWIEVDSELGRGSHFTVYLPRNGRKDGDAHGWQAAVR